MKPLPGKRPARGDAPKSLTAISDATTRTLTLAAAFASACALLLLAFALVFPAKEAADSAGLRRINAAVAVLLQAPGGRGLGETKDLLRAALGTDNFGSLARAVEEADGMEALLAALRDAAAKRRAEAERSARALLSAASFAGILSAAITLGLAVLSRRQSRRQGEFFARLDGLIDAVEDSIRGGGGGIEWESDGWTETRGLARRAARLAGELAFSRELVDATHAAQDLDELLEELPRALGRVLPAERVAIAFLDRAGNVVAERAVSAGASIRLDVGYSQPLAESGLARVAGSARARVIGDLAALPTISPATRLILDEGFRSSLTAPLFFGDRCVGFLFINARAPFAYGPEEAELAERIAASLRAPVYHHYVVQLLLAETARGFVRSMEKRDNETSLHIERMSLYAHAVARELARTSKDD
ncbi:MAG: GAF domain-containing protein, partial [Spirochaetaceae bacterium]|nr:GAF domain-containing protein [Spirochaetaceae bacterium]